MKTTTKLHIIIVLIAFALVIELNGQSYLPDEFRDTGPILLTEPTADVISTLPELVPYSIVPVDLDPGDCRLEVGIILLHPYNIQDMPTPQQTEILEIIYSRIGFEIVNPDMSAGVFQIDDKLYHLIRIPYTGTHW